MLRACISADDPTFASRLVKARLILRTVDSFWEKSIALTVLSPAHTLASLSA